MKRSLGKQEKKSGHSNGPLMLELESRLLLSADLIGPLADQLTDDVLPQAHIAPVKLTSSDDGKNAVESSTLALRELVIIDAATPNYELLLADLLAERNDGRIFEVAVLDGSQDGVDQISALLADRSDISALHIISHGRDGSVSLGDGMLDLDELTIRAMQIQGWGDALTEDADILVYGCNLAAGADGRAFVATLGRLTDADVAASDDLTGAAGLNGDWDLEYRIGQIEANIAVSAMAQENFEAVLANQAPVITSDGGGPTASVNVAENQIAVTAVTYTDADLPADLITYSLSGDDAALFSIDAGGVLTFNTA